MARAINHGEKTYHPQNAYHGECRGCTTDSGKHGQSVILEGEEEISAILLWRRCGMYLEYFGNSPLPAPEDITVESFLELANLLAAFREAYSALHAYNAYCKTYPASIESY